MKRNSLFFQPAFYIALCIVFLLLLAAAASGQASYQIGRPCPGATPSPARSTVTVKQIGDIDLVPCSGRTVQINGAPYAGNISSLNGLTASTQLFATGTTGTDFNIVSAVATHTFNFPSASASNRGLLTSANWTTFNNKIGSLNGLTASTQLFAVGAADTAAWSSVTATHTLGLPITAVSGSSRTNFFPYFNAANTIAKSPFSWDGTSFAMSNTALNTTFVWNYTPDNTNGLFNVGDTATNFSVTKLTDAVDLKGAAITINSKAGTTTIGDTADVDKGVTMTIDGAADNVVFTGDGSQIATFSANADTLNLGLSTDTRLRILNSSDTFNFASVGLVGIVDFDNIANFLMLRTITAAGTTGSQTINKPQGTVNFAALATTVTVTNSLVNANSIIIPTPQDLDATCRNFVIDNKGSGTFDIVALVACTAETPVAFQVFN